MKLIVLIVAYMVHIVIRKPANFNGMFIVAADSRGSFIETASGDIRSYYRPLSIESKINTNP